jgi:hypothetical protein
MSSAWFQSPAQPCWSAIGSQPQAYKEPVASYWNRRNPKVRAPGRRALQIDALSWLSEDRAHDLEAGESAGASVRRAAQIHVQTALPGVQPRRSPLAKPLP